MGTGRGWQQDVLTQKWSPATRPLLKDASENGHQSLGALGP